MARISFTPAPGVDISDADAAVDEVKDGKFFYAVEAPRKEGTMPTKAIVAANDLYEEGYHAGNPGGLDAIDTHLAPANIKSAVDIFGKLGSYVPTLAEDVTGSGITTEVTGASTASKHISLISIPAEDVLDVATKTLNFAAGSRAVAVGFAHGVVQWANKSKLRLYMDGVNVVESSYLSNLITDIRILVGTRALSGEAICKITLTNEDTDPSHFLFYTKEQGDLGPIGIGVGSIKT